MIFLNLWIISYKALAMLTQFYAGYIFTAMVISCVAYGCTNRAGNGCDISFHGGWRGKKMDGKKKEDGWNKGRRWIERRKKMGRMKEEDGLKEERRWTE